MHKRVKPAVWQTFPLRGIVLTLFLLLLPACAPSQPEKGKAVTASGRREARLLAVEVGRVAKRTLVRRFEAVANLQAAQRAVIAPVEPGVVATVLVQLGERVRAGQVLATLEDGEWRERLSQAEAALAAARATQVARLAERDLAASQLAREKTLFAQELTAAQDFEVAKTRLVSAEALVSLAKAEVERARALMAEARQRLDRTRLVAPWAGNVAMRHLDPGARVVAGTPVVTLLSAEPLRAFLAVPEAEFTQLQPGARARLYLDTLPERPFAARVSRVAPGVNLETRTGQIELQTVSQQEGLRDGMLARVTLEVERREGVLSVPAAAMVSTPSGPGVYLAEREKAVFVALETGLTDAGWVEVRSASPALRPGAAVVTNGVHLVKSGSRLQLQGGRPSPGGE